jgi:hypothetical protein
MEWARRAIPWETLEEDVAEGKISQQDRLRVGESWLHRMKQEHLAVGAFASLALELAREGCDPRVLELVTRASSDEVRHAEICRRYAACLLGGDAVAPRLRGLKPLPRQASTSPADETLLHVVEMCCLSETLTGVYFTEMLARTDHPTTRATVEALLEDEVDHGRVGWTYLAERARTGTARIVEQRLGEMIARSFGHFLKPAEPRSTKTEAAQERIGLLSANSVADLYQQAFSTIILPGFEELGFDVADAQETVARLRR